MNTFLLTIATPDGSMFADQAVGLFVRGAEGDLAVLAGHVPFVTTVKPGVCRVEVEIGPERRGRCDGGILTVSAEGTTLLAGTFVWDE